MDSGNQETGNTGNQGIKRNSKSQEQENPFPQFSLEDSLSDFLTKENIELSVECQERVINLSKSRFVSNPSKMKEEWFVDHFATGITTTKRVNKSNKTGESNKKVNSWYDKTGYCKLCGIQKNAYPHKFFKHIKSCIMTEQRREVFIRIINEYNYKYIQAAVQHCMPGTAINEENIIITPPAKKLKQSTFDDFAIDGRAGRLLECILFIAKTDQSIRLIDSDDFYNLLTRFNSNWRSPSHTAVTNQYIPAVAIAIKQYVISRLRGHSVTLILDEMRNPCGSYINFVIAVNKESSDDMEMYFWECMESSGSTARQIATKISEVADELENYDIICQSYATDNCHAMIKTEQYCTTKSGRNIVRVPCSSHILNNILKDFVEKNPDIRETWSLVHEANAAIIKSPILREKLLELQATIPPIPLQLESFLDNTENSNCSSFQKSFYNSMAELSECEGDENENENEDSRNEDANNNPCGEALQTDSSRTKPLHLLSFFDVRWYSAWMVMRRFYILWNVLTRLYSHIDPDDHPKFADAFKEIDKLHLLYIVQLLYPLVESIDYCQRDSSRSVDGLSIIKKLRDYYLDKGVVGLENDEVEKIFSDRLKLFNHLSEGLQELFSLPYSKKLDDSEKKNLVKKCIDELLKISIPDMDKQEIENIAYMEVPLFLDSGTLRKGLTISGFFHSYNNRNQGQMFVLLPRVYEQLRSQIASSAAVERSFSEQALIQTSRRRLLKTKTVNNLMLLKCNLKFLKRRGMEQQLRKYLFDNNPLKDILVK